MRTPRTLTAAGTIVALALTAHTAVNLRALRRPPADPAPPAEQVALLLPVRDEADRIGPCLQALRALLCRSAGQLTLTVLDDGSTDGTGDLVRARLGDLPGVRVLEGAPLPTGWLGKPHACDQLARAAGEASVLVFLDADVTLAPQAVDAAVALLRSARLDLVSPYPRQLATGFGQRLVQPLLQWSWATTLPLRLAEDSPRPSLSAANGQFLVVDAAAYRRAGGHAAVRTDVLEDLALLRAIKAAGGRGTVVDGTELATCRMYATWPDLVDGYGKSLWSAFGGRGASAAVAGLLLLAYVVPAAAALGGSVVGGSVVGGSVVGGAGVGGSGVAAIGAAGYAAGVTGRVLVARRTGGRVWPDALAHPLSVLAFTGLLARSWRQHDRGTLRWRGRPVTVASGGAA